MFKGNIKKTARNKYAINDKFLFTDSVDGSIEEFMKVYKTDESFKSKLCFH